MILLYCQSNGKQTKVGFSVSKKYGKAVARNRIRRQMKAAVSGVIEQVKHGYNIVLIPRRSEAYLYSDLVVSVTNLLKKAGLMQ